MLDQTQRRIQSQLSQKVGVFCGSRQSSDTESTVVVASIQSIFKTELNNLNLIILDECHNINQDYGRYFDFIELHKNKNPKLQIVAFTATPFRSNGYIFGKDKLFKKITYKKELKETIYQGYLVKPILKKVNHQFDISKLKIQNGDFRKDQIEALTGDESKVFVQITDALLRIEERKKIVWACSSIKHCELVHTMLLNKFNEQASLIHSKQPDDIRKHNLHRFENEDVKHLVFVSIVSEGYDFKPIDCVILMRPMRSPVLYVQTIGRGLRICDGKTDCLVLDYGRVVESCGPLDNPKFVSGSKDKITKDQEMKACPSCECYCLASEKRCPVCDYEFPSKKIPDLNLTSDEESLLLSNKKSGHSIKLNVEKVTITKDHLSKAGNKCLKITYTTNNLLYRTVSEYFSMNSPYGQKKAAKRLMALDVEDYIANTLPKTITLDVTNKYPEITRVDFL